MFTTQQGPDGVGARPILPSWPSWLHEVPCSGPSSPRSKPSSCTQTQASISLQAPALGRGPQVGLPELRGAAPSPEHSPDITH